MRARARRRLSVAGGLGLAGVLLVAGLLGSRTHSSPSSADGASAGAADAPAPAAFPAIEAERATLRAAPAGRSPTDAPTPVYFVEVLPYGFFGSEADDPALPEERVPLAVTLVDPVGRPIPHAAVQAVWGEWRTKTRFADARGRVTLAVPLGARALEVVGMPRSETRRFLLVHVHDLSGTESAARVEVRAGSEITGTLVGPDGAPVAKARIRAIPQAYGFAPTTSDEHGAFRLNVLADTEVDVMFDGCLDLPAPCEYVSLRARAHRVRAGTTGLVLTAETVEYGESLPLRVLDPRGDPLVGAEVIFLMGGGTHGHSLFTDATGRVTLTAQTPWPTDVDVHLADGSQHRFEELLPGAGEVEARLPPQTRLAGRVLDSKGRAVANAWCSAFSGNNGLAVSATDGEGRFSMLLPVAAGTRIQLSARFPAEEPTSRGVASGVTVGGVEPTLVLEEVGPLESEARRANKFDVSVRAGVGFRER